MSLNVLFDSAQRIELDLMSGLVFHRSTASGRLFLDELPISRSKMPKQFQEIKAAESNRT